VQRGHAPLAELTVSTSLNHTSYSLSTRCTEDQENN